MSKKCLKRHQISLFTLKHQFSKIRLASISFGHYSSEKFQDFVYEFLKISKMVCKLQLHFVWFKWAEITYLIIDYFQDAKF